MHTENGLINTIVGGHDNIPEFWSNVDPERVFNAHNELMTTY